MAKDVEEFDALLVEARERLLAGKPVDAVVDGVKRVEASDPVLVNELLAERADIDDQIKALTVRKKAIEAIIRDVIGDDDELSVHGAKVASVARWRETRVVSDAVKSLFPVVDYPELYVREDKSRLTIH